MRLFGIIGHKIFSFICMMGLATSASQWTVSRLAVAIATQRRIEQQMNRPTRRQIVCANKGFLCVTLSRSLFDDMIRFSHFFPDPLSRVSSRVLVADHCICPVYLSMANVASSFSSCLVFKPRCDGDDMTLQTRNNAERQRYERATIRPALGNTNNRREL